MDLIIVEVEKVIWPTHDEVICTRGKVGNERVQVLAGWSLI